MIHRIYKVIFKRKLQWYNQQSTINNQQLASKQLAQLSTKPVNFEVNSKLSDTQPFVKAYPEIAKKIPADVLARLSVVNGQIVYKARVGETVQTLNEIFKHIGYDKTDPDMVGALVNLSKKPNANIQLGALGPKYAPLQYAWSSAPSKIELKTGNYATTFTAPTIPVVAAKAGEGLWQLAERLKLDPTFAAAFQGKTTDYVVATLRACNMELQGETAPSLKAGQKLAVLTGNDGVSQRLNLALAGMGAGLGDEVGRQIKAAIPVIALALGGMAVAGAVSGPAAVALIGSVLSGLGIVMTGAQIAQLAKFLGDVCFANGVTTENAYQKGKDAQKNLASLFITLGTFGAGKAVSGIANARAAAQANAVTALAASTKVPAGAEGIAAAAKTAPVIKGFIGSLAGRLRMQILPTVIGDQQKYILLQMLNAEHKPVWVNVKADSPESLTRTLVDLADTAPDGLKLPIVDGKPLYVLATEQNGAQHFMSKPWEDSALKGVFNKAGTQQVGASGAVGEAPTSSTSPVPAPFAPDVFNHYVISKQDAVNRLEKLTTQDVLDMPIRDLDISTRPFNVLISNNISTVKDLCKIRTEEFFQYRMAGKKGYVELEELLNDFGLKFDMTDADIASFLATGKY